MNTQATYLKRGSTLFLKAAVGAIGAAVLALCLFALPAMWRAVPGEYPADYHYVFYWIIGAMWLAAIPFFYALIQAIRLLGLIDRNEVFSKASVSAVQRIGYSALFISLIYAASMPFFYIWADNDDAPGLVIISMVLVMAPLTIAVCAALLQRLLHEVIAMKSENELTV